MSETNVVSPTTEGSGVERVVIRFSPKPGDEFIARPQLAYDLLIKVLNVGEEFVSVITKKGTTMDITFADWNKYVMDKG